MFSNHPHAFTLQNPYYNCMTKLDTKYEYILVAAILATVTLGSMSQAIPWDTLYRFTTTFAIITLVYHLFRGDTA